MNENGFEIILRDFSEYEHLVAQIEFEGQIICQINREMGVEFLEVKFFPDFYLGVKDKEMKFPLEIFISVLEKVKILLAEDANFGAA